MIRTISIAVDQTGSNTVAKRGAEKSIVEFCRFAFYDRRVSPVVLAVSRCPSIHKSERMGNAPTHFLMVESTLVGGRTEKCMDTGLIPGLAEANT